MQQIFPVDATVIAYGPGSAVNKIRSVFIKLVAEDRMDLGKKEVAALAKEIEVEAAAKAIDAARIDREVKLSSTGGKKTGLRMRLPEMTERFLSMELLDLPFAKTATCLLTWDSRNDNLHHQALWSTGGMQQYEKAL